MTIQVGTLAPEFMAQAYVPGEHEPRTIQLSALRGSWVVLFFYPRDFTFVCPTEIQAFAHLLPEFKRERAIVLAASTDSYYCQKAWYESDTRLHEVNYPIIADTAQQLSAAYGVLQEDGAALRGTFIIDPEGIVRHVQVNDHDVGRNVERYASYAPYALASCARPPGCQDSPPSPPYQLRRSWHERCDPHGVLPQRRPHLRLSASKGPYLTERVEAVFGEKKEMGFLWCEVTRAIGTSLPGY